MSMNEYTPVLELPPGLIRDLRPQLALDQVVLNNVNTSLASGPINVARGREFALFLRLASSGTPTTLQVIVEFREWWSKRWHKLDEGVFASLFFEDTELATEIDRLYTGRVVAEEMRVRIVGSGTTAANTFTVSAAIGLWT